MCYWLLVEICINIIFNLMTFNSETESSDKKMLIDYEKLFSSRYTDKDSDYSTLDIKKPICITPWKEKSNRGGRFYSRNMKNESFHRSGRDKVDAWNNRNSKKKDGKYSDVNWKNNVKETNEFGNQNAHSSTNENDSRR